MQRYKRFLVMSLLSILLGSGCSSIRPQTRSAELGEEPEVSYLFEQGQQMFEAGQFQNAIETWEQILPEYPHYIDAQLGIRKARLKIKSLQQQQQAASRKSSQLDTLIAKAEHLEQEGKWTEAAQKYEQAYQLDPQNIQLHNKIEELHALLDNTLERHSRLGEIYLAQGEYDKARAEWQHLLRLDPDNETAQQRLADIEALTATSDTVFFKRGRSLLEKGLVNAARTEFEKALRINPTNERTREHLAKIENISSTDYTVKSGDTLSSIARKFSGKSDNFQVLADFNQLDPDRPLEIGQTLKIPHILGFQKTLAPEAPDIVTEPKEEFPQIDSRTIPTPPDVPRTEARQEALEIALNKGVIAFSEGNYREAVSILEQVLLQDPDNEEAYRYFVKATENMRRGTSAPTEILPVHTLGQDEAPRDAVRPDAQRLIQTGLEQREAGDIKAAVATFEQASQLAPDNPQVAMHLEETRDELQKLITAHLNEGIKKFNQELLEDAIVEWNRVLELDPDNQQAADYKERAEIMLNALAAQPSP